jgi:hypothetical protein
MMDLAAKTAKEVYNKPTTADLQPFAFVEEGEKQKIPADKYGGSVKETNIRLYKPIQEFGEHGNEMRVVVVAIRGTSSIHDWMVNFKDTALPKKKEDSIKSDFIASFHIN